MTVAKIVELVGESQHSWDEAVRSAVRNAAQTVEGITGVEIMNITGHVHDGEITEYKANIKLAFGVRDDR
ncbi:MAG: dodecin domain-containing protein [Firmicutes bacterium]|nr:dodecin domain-containing protein [Bacillota bacterium]